MWLLVLEIFWKIYLLALRILFGAYKVCLEFGRWVLLDSGLLRPTVEVRKNVVIIGGGFAGTLCARELEHYFNVTLIDRKEYFEFTPR